MNFIEKLGALLKSHISLINALALLSSQASTKEQKIILEIKKSVSEGLSLSEAMRKFPDKFDHLTIHLINAGEESASLTQVCENISQYHAKISLLKRRLTKALFYPVLIFSISLIISMGLLIFIVPQFEQLFESAGAPLPFLTRQILSFSAMIQHHSLFILMSLALITLLLYYYKNKFIYVIFILPYLGEIAKKIMLSRFAYTISIMLESGIPLTQALETCASVLHHQHYEKALSQIKIRVTKGEKLSEGFIQSALFPPSFIQFILIGEQACSLPFYLNKLAQLYDEQTDSQLNILTLLIEPLIMIILGLFIGGLIIAMYLPVFELGKVV